MLMNKSIFYIALEAYCTCINEAIYSVMIFNWLWIDMLILNFAKVVSPSSEDFVQLLILMQGEDDKNSIILFFRIFRIMIACQEILKKFNLVLR